MPELLRGTSERRQMEHYSLKTFCAILLLFHNFSLLDGFQWSFRQQASHVIDVAVGSDISLPCEYVLTPQEQQEANIFHLLTWTREEPMNSDSWAGLAIKSTLTGSDVIYDDPQRIFITNGTLTVKNVNTKDHTHYQCAFQSSFYTTPSTILLNVQHKPMDTQLTVPSSEVKVGEPFDITCTARANPSPEYKFYHDGKLIRWSSTGVLSFASIKSEDQGTYRCVPNNKLGDGPEATVTVTVNDSEGFPLWAYFAIAGIVLFFALVAAVIAICRARKANRKPENKRGKETQPRSNALRPGDAREAHVGPGAFYGDHMNGGTQIPQLNGALSFSDIRMSREIPVVRGAFSADDVRMAEIPVVNGALSADDVRMAEIPVVNGALSADDVRMGETAFSRLEAAYPTRSIAHLIDGVEEHVSQL